MAVWPGWGSGNCGTLCARMHREKASRLADLELLDDDCPDGLDDPTLAAPGPGELCEQPVASSATATSGTVNTLMCRVDMASPVAMPASLAAGPPRHIPHWWEGGSLLGGICRRFGGGSVQACWDASGPGRGGFRPA
jgi:hypothetical protein